MLGQFDPVISQAVDIRGFYFLLAITLQVAITHIVHQYIYNVRFALFFLAGRQTCNTEKPY